jgi:tRNA (guanine37-N1)-methyltransferase
MRIDIITIFPEYFTPLTLSLIGKAGERGLIDVAVHDLRDWTTDVHRTVDDAPFGGGPGMVMLPEPWGAALDTVVGDATPPPTLIVTTPTGRTFTQALAAEYAQRPWLVVACGRYEGIDARVVEDARRRMSVDEVSIGDYVLSGGEAAALVLIEATVRLLPGVIGNAESAADDSFTHGLLEGPSYTRPASWRDLDVPEVLRSGDHAAIARWRRDAALRRTAALRPELLAAVQLSERDREAIESAGPAPDGPADVAQ